MKEKNLTVAHQGKAKVLPLNSDAQELYKILQKLPKPFVSMKLSTAQKKWWYWFGNEFVSTKQFSKVDITHLHKAAFWMDARCQAIKKINESGYAGLVQTFITGANNVTGHVSIVEKADKHLEEVSSHFGLSIKDRSKLKLKDTAPEGQYDLFTDLLKTLHA